MNDTVITQTGNSKDYHHHHHQHHDRVHVFVNTLLRKAKTNASL